MVLLKPMSPMRKKQEIMHMYLKAGDILAFGSDISVRNRHYNFQEFLGCYERLATFQAKAARQERIKVSLHEPLAQLSIT